MKKTLPVSMRWDPELKRDVERLAAAENRKLANFVETEMRRIRDQAIESGKLRPEGKRK